MAHKALFFALILPRKILYIYTMMKPYIKGIPRCMFMHIHLCAGWYASYTPHMYYAHLRNILIQLKSPLVAIVIDEQSFQVR